MRMLVKIAPENLEVANSYLETGNMQTVSDVLCIPQTQVAEILNKREVKTYIDSVYLDQGYRNRFKLANLLDKIIDSKVEQAEETQVYSNKDLADLLTMAHKMRMDEIKAMTELTVKYQTNVQINNTADAAFGQGNYGKLMEKLLKND